jgi:hypothetical protein
VIIFLSLTLVCHVAVCLIVWHYHKVHVHHCEWGIITKCTCTTMSESNLNSICQQFVHVSQLGLLHLISLQHQLLFTDFPCGLQQVM